MVAVAITAVIVVAVALAAVLLLRKGREPQDWQRAAQVLGIAAVGPMQLAGRVGKNALEVKFDRARDATELRVELDPPLDLGLDARKRPAPAVEQQDALDRLMALAAEEPRRLKALMAGDVRAALLPSLGAVVELGVSDHAVWFALGGVATADVILVQARVVLELADVIDAERSRVPLPEAVQPIKRSWQALAEELRLRLRTTPFGFEGQLDGRDFRCWAERRAPGQFRAVIRFRFTPGRGAMVSDAAKADLLALLGEGGEVIGAPEHFTVAGALCDGAALKRRLDRCRELLLPVSV